MPAEGDPSVMAPTTLVRVPQGLEVPESITPDEDHTELELEADTQKPLSVTPFLTKLFDLLSDQSRQSLIKWGAAGKSVQIVDPVRFQSQVLPNHWRHNNLRSFIRNLHLYGFQRTCEDVSNGRLEFFHENFLQVCMQNPGGCPTRLASTTMPVLSHRTHTPLLHLFHLGRGEKTYCVAFIEEGRRASGC